MSTGAAGKRREREAEARPRSRGSSAKPRLIARAAKVAFDHPLSSLNTSMLTSPISRRGAHARTIVSTRRKRGEEAEEGGEEKEEGGGNHNLPTTHSSGPVTAPLCSLHAAISASMWPRSRQSGTSYSRHRLVCCISPLALSAVTASVASAIAMRCSRSTTPISSADAAYSHTSRACYTSST